MPVMAHDGLKAVLERLGLKQAELARLLDVSPRTVSQWATGDQPLPGPVAGYLRLLESADPARRHDEFERLGVRAKTLDEGIYRVVYRGADDGEGDTALAVLRNGKILGSDPHGGVFMGSYSFDAENDLNTVHL
ncbi:MAG: helix-turn-helix domain-containing protein, partial [Hyphomicrobium sp.]